MEVAHIEAWRADPRRFWRFYASRFHALAGKRPNRAHRALAELERRGVLRAVVTQNIDRLHARAGTRELVEVHGSIATSSCLRDGERYALEEVVARVRDEPDGVPRCACGAPLKPDVVLFGELLPAAAHARATELAAEADLLVCVGTSLEVWPVADLPGVTRARGGHVALVTQGPTSWDSRAAVKLTGDVEEELVALARLL
jgi:NAD-dependent deacetylase